MSAAKKQALTLVIVVEGAVSAAAAKLRERYPNVRVETRSLFVELGPRDLPQAVLSYCRESNVDVTASCLVSRSVAAAPSAAPFPEDAPLGDRENDDWLDLCYSLSAGEIRKVSVFVGAMRRAPL